MHCLLFYMCCNEHAIAKPLVMHVDVSLLPDLMAALDNTAQGDLEDQRRRKAKCLARTDCSDR